MSISIALLIGLIVVFLHLNIRKTKELCLRAQTRMVDTSPYKPVIINGKFVEQVSNCKYLGTIIDDKLKFEMNVESVYKKARECLGLLKKLRSFNVSTQTLTMVYRSMIESIHAYNIVSWYGNITVKQKNKLSQIINQTDKITGYKQHSLQVSFDCFMEKTAIWIFKDHTHPIHSAFEMRPSRRLKIPLVRRKAYKN